MQGPLSPTAPLRGAGPVGFLLCFLSLPLAPPSCVGGGASCPSWGVSVSCRVPQTLCANPPPPTWAAAALRMSAGEGERHVLPCRPPGRLCPVAYTHGSGRLAVRLSVHPSTAVWVAPVPGLWWVTLRRSRRASASPQRSWRRAAGTATAGRAALSSSVVPSSVNKPWLL